MNIFKKIKLSFILRTKYRPYFKKAKKDFKEYKAIDLATYIPKEITDIYKQLKTNEGKYKKYIKEYDEMLSLVKNHNIDINNIRKDIEDFNYDDILSNIKSNSVEKLIDKYQKGFDEIKKYDVIDDDMQQEINEYNLIINGYTDALKQYDFLNEIKEMFPEEGDAYICKSKRKDIIDKAKYIKDSIKNHSAIYYDFLFLDNIEKVIDDNNETYLNKNCSNPFFDDINGLSLDNDQRKAILKDEQSLLVVAGAGSGKTLTICGKVKYLLEEQHVNAKDILLLSYSKKSSIDLANKVSKIHGGLKVNTFHKLGLDILKKVHNTSYVVEEQFNAILESYFSTYILNNPQAMNKVLQYYSLYSSNQTYNEKYDNKDELYSKLKQEDLNTLKDTLAELSGDGFKRQTLKKELVKSNEELAIANFYFINGINYEYERPYIKDLSTPDKRQYLPDFYLTDYKIYHEHYGVNKNDRAPQFGPVMEREYINNMLWKRNVHALYNSKYIETKSYQMQEGILFDELEKKLKAMGVVFKPLSDQQVYNALNSIYSTMHFKSFISLVKTFISLYKSKYRDDKAFDELANSNFINRYQRNRASLFLDICKDIYHYYMNHIRSEGKIDFDDMILLSKEALNNTNEFKYKYIIVDEFQDISISRKELLKEMISHGNAKLFAVGDDWQSIYRFAGSDVDIFTNFDKYFDDSDISFIHATHRNSQELQNIACSFIMKNPEQLKKEIHSEKRLIDPVELYYYQNRDVKRDCFLSLLNKLYQEDNKSKILLLGRNNDDITTLLCSTIRIDNYKSDEENIYIKSLDFPELEIKYTTVHGSKGLEEDNVIIINAEDSILGFPNQIEDDVLLNLVLANNSTYDFAEERRLWYVALTRTRNKTYVLVDENNPSIFVKEIEKQCISNKDDETKSFKKQYTCPECGGKLVLRKDSRTNRNFWGCSNYPRCKYTIDCTIFNDFEHRCPRCGDYLIVRKGRYGYFRSCHNKYCKYTENSVTSEDLHKMFSKN